MPSNRSLRSSRRWPLNTLEIGSRRPPWRREFLLDAGIAAVVFALSLAGAARLLQKQDPIVPAIPCTCRSLTGLNAEYELRYL